MPTEELSEGALALLRLHFSGHSLMMGACNPDSLPGYTVEETRAAYRELVAAGLMDPLHTFAHGRDSRYRLTLAAVERKAEWLESRPFQPSFIARRILPRPLADRSVRLSARARASSCPPLWLSASSWTHRPVTRRPSRRRLWHESCSAVHLGPRPDTSAAGGLEWSRFRLRRGRANPGWAFTTVIGRCLR